MAVGARSCLAISCRINHLGINPVRGGRPPRDSRIMGVIAVTMGALAHEAAIILTVVVLLILNVRKAENVITKYNKRARSVSEGEN